MKASGREPKAESAYSGSVSAQGDGPAPSRPVQLNSEGLPTGEWMRQQHQEWADQQSAVTSCAFCADWTFEGPAGQGRELALEHRQQHHPDACVRRPRMRKRISKRTLRTAGEEEQIKVDAAEARRIRHEREQDEMLAKIEKGRARDRAARAALDIA